MTGASAESTRRPIRSVAVLGAGTMGAQIAAHVANAGLGVLLLDLDADTARSGLKRATALKPDPFFTRAAQTRIRLGGFDRDLPEMAGCDWIIEAIIERLDAKQALLEQVEAHRRADAIVTSNTSGIPIGTLAEGRSEAFRRHWLGSHFFNPPRYLRLVEIVPTGDTDPAVVTALSKFVDRQLGKGVVVAKDTPNFIANRIGLYGVTRVLEQLASGPYTIEEIDAMTGPVVGRPKSATFRTMDIAGIDILAHVATNLSARLDTEDERRAFELPPLVGQLVERGWIGEKAGQGFYKKERGRDGSTIRTLDPADHGLPAAAIGPARRPRRGADDRRPWGAGAQPVSGPRHGRRVHARDTRPHPDLRSRGGRLDRPHRRRRRPGDAVGLRVGPGTVRGSGTPSGSRRCSTPVEATTCRRRRASGRGSPRGPPGRTVPDASAPRGCHPSGRTCSCSAQPSSVARW